MTSRSKPRQVPTAKGPFGESRGAEGAAPIERRRRRRYPLLRSGAAWDCPACGEPRDRLEPFGLMDGTGEPLLRCSGCLAGMSIQTPGFPRRAKLELVDPELWSAIERARDAEISAEEETLIDPGAMITSLRKGGLSGEPLVHVVAEALNIPAEEAEQLAAEH
jgi:hypothetical protein